MNWFIYAYFAVGLLYAAQALRDFGEEHGRQPDAIDLAVIPFFVMFLPVFLFAAICAAWGVRKHEKD